MMRTFWLALVVTGCAADPGWRWTPVNPAELPTAKQYPDASAVVLLHERKIDMFTDTHESNWYRQITHERRLILSEAGFKYADVKLSRHNEERTEFLRARIISPDGQVEEVDANRILVAEQKSEKDASKNRVEHRFRFPNVKVGSVLEWVVGTQRFGVLGYLDEQIASELPVKRYAIEMMFRKHVSYALKAYNVNTQFKTERHGDVIHVSFELLDVPAVQDEDDAIARAHRVPRIVYRAQGLDWGRGLHPHYADWPSTMSHTASALYLENKKLLEGVTLAAGEGCGDRRCVVDRALALVHEKAPLSEFVSDTDELRPLKQVLASGSGNNYEKAYLLWHLLEKAKVNARLALLARYRNGSLDRSFPLPMPFNHLVVFVPKQLGIESPLWIDPSCEHCAVDQLPPWSAECDALVLWARSREPEEPEVKAEFHTLRPATTSTDSVQRTARAKLEATGDLEVELQEEWRGREAVERRLTTRTWLAKDWTEETERVARARATTARVRESQRDECDRARGVCRRVLRFTLPGYATLEEGRLLVPLTVLHSSFDAHFTDAKRKHDLDFHSAFRLDEIASIQLPDGWSVDELPSATHEKSSAFDLAFTVARDKNEVVARRVLDRRGGRFAVAEYESIRKVVRAFAATRDKMVVLRKAR